MTLLATFVTPICSRLFNTFPHAQNIELFPKFWDIDCKICFDQVVLSVAGGGDKFWRNSRFSFPTMPFSSQQCPIRRLSDNPLFHCLPHPPRGGHSSEKLASNTFGFDLEIKFSRISYHHHFIMIIITFTFWTAWSFLQCRWWLPQTWCFWTAGLPGVERFE